MWGIHLSVDGWALIYIVKRLMKWEPSIYQYVILRFVFSHKVLSTFRSSKSQPISVSKRGIQNEDGDEIETFHQNVWRFLCVQKSAKDQQPQRKIYNQKINAQKERPNMIMIAQMTIYGISLHKFDIILVDVVSNKDLWEYVIRIKIVLGLECRLHGIVSMMKSVAHSSWHVQNLDMTGWFQTKLELTEWSQEFYVEIIRCLWNGCIFSVCLKTLQLLEWYLYPLDMPKLCAWASITTNMVGKTVGAIMQYFTTITFKINIFD